MIGLSIPVNDRYGGSVLARIWHGCRGPDLQAAPAAQAPVNPCLQIAVSSWVNTADLRQRPSGSDRSVPLPTRVNGTLMA